MTAPLDASTVAQYLSEHPNFFEEHTSLLGEVKLSSPITGRTISLQERQMEVMRDKYKALELRLSELARHAKENETIAARFHTCSAENMTAEELIEFLAQRGKFTAGADGFSVDPSTICQH